MNDDRDWQSFKQAIDELLDQHRPERAGQGEKDWREPVYGWARNHIPNEQNIVRRFAQEEVDRREALATKVGNKIVRAWMHGQSPLIWGQLGAKPIIVGKLRIRCDVATAEDFDAAAQQIENAAKKTFDEAMQLAQGYRDLGHETIKRGVDHAPKLGDLAPRAPGRPIEVWDVDDMPDPIDFGAVITDDDDEVE